MLTWLIIKIMITTPKEITHYLYVQLGSVLVLHKEDPYLSGQSRKNELYWFCCYVVFVVDVVFHKLSWDCSLGYNKQLMSDYYKYSFHYKVIHKDGSLYDVCKTYKNRKHWWNILIKVLKQKHENEFKLWIAFWW